MFPVVQTAPPPSLTFEEITMFHEMDRNLFNRLTSDLYRDPADCMRIMALWLWLEAFRFTNLIETILTLPFFLINEFADESLICINFLMNSNPTNSFPDHVELPLTQSLLGNDMSLNFFAQNREEAVAGIRKAWSETCLRALQDLMLVAIERKAARDLAEAQMAMSSMALSNSERINPRFVNPQEAVHPDDRTIFATFSKGYPVPESDIREFFNIMYGDCIESIRIDDQSLFARIVLYTPDIIQVVLNGETLVKFNIKGRHMWMRKFVSRRRRSVSPQPQ